MRRFSAWPCFRDSAMDGATCDRNGRRAANPRGRGLLAVDGGKKKRQSRIAQMFAPGSSCRRASPRLREREHSACASRWRRVPPFSTRRAVMRTGAFTVSRAIALEFPCVGPGDARFLQPHRR
jgi:hypothetical protein